ncbi:MAG: AAA family ATPase [Eubacteriales bacterium]
MECKGKTPLMPAESLSDQRNPNRIFEGSAAALPVLTLSNQKGGVGKTTSAVNIAAALGVRGKRVLLCDIDPQGNATSGVGINKKQLAASSYDVLIGRCTAAEAIVKTQFENLSALPANISLAACELEISSLDDRQSRLSNALDSVRGDYDYIIVDCPPSLGLLTINGLCAADGVIIPMQCEYYALEGLSQLVMSIRQVKKLYNPRLEITGILITMYNGRLNLSMQVMDELKKYYAAKLFSTTVVRNVRLSEAPSYGMPIQYFDKSSKGAHAYDDIAAEIIERTE